MSSVQFSDIEDAADRLEGVVSKTPVLSSPLIDEMAGRRVMMKCENLQHIGAFKFRGASNAVKMLGKEADLKKTKADFEKLIASAFEKAAK